MTHQHTTQTKTSENDRTSQASTAAKSSAAPAMHPMLHLQRQMGNRAVGQLIQAKLTVGEANDVYEQEADRVAAEVVRQIHMPQNVSTNQTTSVQRQVVGNDEKELRMKPLIQCKSDMGGMAVSSEIESSIQQARGSGQPLAEGIRTPMEQAFGADFGGVRVHTDERSDQLNRSIQAKAFTTGKDIFFRKGEYSPASHTGQELLAHELTHVVQQRGELVETTNKLSDSSKILTIGRIIDRTAPQETNQFINVLQLTSQRNKPSLQCALSDNEKEEFKPQLKILSNEYTELISSASVFKLPKRFIDGIKLDLERTKDCFQSEKTTYDEFYKMLDKFAEKIDHLKQYASVLLEVNSILEKEFEGSPTTKNQLVGRIDQFENFLQYNQLEDAVLEKGAETLNSLLDFARRWRKKDKLNDNKISSESLTTEEKIFESAKDGPGSYVDFDRMKNDLPYKVKLWRSDFTYSDQAKTQKKDIVKMYEIKWTENPKTKKEYAAWVLHIHLTLNEKVTVAHFKRAKNHLGGAGSNLTNYDGNIARMFYDTMRIAIEQGNVF